MSGRKETKMLLVISSIQLERFCWNSLHSLLVSWIKFATKSCTSFPPHLNTCGLFFRDTSQQPLNQGEEMRTRNLAGNVAASLGCYVHYVHIWKGRLSSLSQYTYLCEGNKDGSHTGPMALAQGGAKRPFLTVMYRPILCFLCDRRAVGRRFIKLSWPQTVY